MARPQKEGLDYFPHETTASYDRKIQALLSLSGVAGLGFYWFIVELLYKEHGFMLDVSDADTIQILCRNMSITEQDFDRYLQICLKYGLFRKDIYAETKQICSDGVNKRAAAITQKREEERKKYQQRKGVSAAETFQQFYENSESSTQRKGK